MPYLIRKILHPNDWLEVAFAFEDDDVRPEPGQFYMFRLSPYAPILPRPFAVYDYDGAYMTFLVRMVGEGTWLIWENEEGLELYGPYGKPFHAPDDKPLVIVGGGIGIAPLNFIAEDYIDSGGRYLRSYLGFDGKKFDCGFLEQYSRPIITTEGYITDKVQIIYPDEVVVACGPRPMLETMCKIVPPENPLYLSLESRMACGVGACLGCVTDFPLVYKKTDSGLVLSKTKQVKVCTDGPVFKREIV